MPLLIGDQAPDFDLDGHLGRTPIRLRLADFKGQKHVVLYFYPRDFTPVCTQEACGFRDAYAALASDTEVIGVSVDGDDTHARFSDKHALPFPLISDRARSLARSYGATSLLSNLFGSTKRVTYVIDKQGRIAAVFKSELFASKHVDGVLATIERLRREG